MRGRLAVWIAVVGLVLLHFVLHVGLGVGRVAPDLLTVALLLAAREVEVGTAAGMGLVFGLLEDALGVVSFGANAVSMTLLGMLGAVTRDLFVGDSILFLVSYFVLGSGCVTWSPGS
jgi:rod shape-determining protein MreD